MPAEHPQSDRLWPVEQHLDLVTVGEDVVGRWLAVAVDVRLRLSAKEGSDALRDLTVTGDQEPGGEDRRPAVDKGVVAEAAGEAACWEDRGGREFVSGRRYGGVGQGQRLLAGAGVLWLCRGLLGFSCVLWSRCGFGSIIRGEYRCLGVVAGRKASVAHEASGPALAAASAGRPGWDSHCC